MSKVEEVARALNPRAWWWDERKRPDDLESLAQRCRQTSFDKARQVIAAMRNPTEAMVKIGYEASQYGWSSGGMDDDAAVRVYQDMIDAALKE